MCIKFIFIIPNKNQAIPFQLKLILRITRNVYVYKISSNQISYYRQKRFDHNNTLSDFVESFMQKEELNIVHKPLQLTHAYKNRSTYDDYGT